MGPRLAQAATAYGWPTLLCEGSGTDDHAAECAAILAACQRFQADILLFDDDGVSDPRSHALREQMLARLRALRPSIRLVSLHFDCWHIQPADLRRSAEAVDAIWATAPSLPVWDDPVFAGKLLQAPFPHAGFIRAPDPAPPRDIRFVGALLIYNWPRILWRAAAIRHRLPIDWQLSYHLEDDRTPLDSYADYMTRLAAGGCSLNFAMRMDLSYIVTGRSFEAMLAGALLIQETAPAYDHFFTAGEHYLPFRSFAELRAACDLVTRDPVRAQQIRQAGHAFAVARYADDKLFGYLDALLFHRPPPGC
jgi:hypothetical protein